MTLPALSPTMEVGMIVSWEKNEGDEIAEGDTLAQVRGRERGRGGEGEGRGKEERGYIEAGESVILEGNYM